MVNTHASRDDDDSRVFLITVSFCYLIAIFEGIDLQAAGVAAPKLAPAFHMLPNQLGWFFSSSTFGLMLGAAIGGRLSDRFGRKAVLVAAVVVFGLMSVFTALSPNVEALLSARFLTGLGIGGALPNLVALVSENTPSARKNMAVGLLYAGLPSGGALASLVAVLAKEGSWTVVFFVGGIAPLISVPVLLWLLPESRQLQAAKQAQAPSQSTEKGFLFALFGDGRLAYTLLLWLSFFLALLTMYLLLNWLPTLLVSRGMSKADASLVQVSFNVLGALGSVCTGLLLDRATPGKIVIAAFGSATLSLLLLANVTPGLMAALAVGGLVGSTMSATQALLYALAPRVYRTEIRGTGVGSAVALGRAGSAVGPLLAAILLTSGKTPHEVLLMLVPIMLIAGATALFMVAMMRRDVSSSPRL